MYNNASKGDFTLVDDSNGVKYVGFRNTIRKALVQRSSADAAEREKIMTTGRADSTVVNMLKRMGVVVRTIDPENQTVKQLRSDARANKRQRSQARSVERAFYNAVYKFSGQFTDYTQESPDADPEHSAPDLALNFFHEYPQWPEWARHFRMSRQEMLSSVTDHVYQAMLDGMKSDSSVKESRLTLGDVRAIVRDVVLESRRSK